jgi:DNA invertase Pin-like site-specific DNA recombinase
MGSRTLNRSTTLRAVQAPLRAAIYGRASSDPRKRGRSVKDQFADCEAECADRGWTIHDHYEDRDRSASSRAKKVREDYERLIHEAEAGLFDVIVYAERSRASRNLEVSLALRNLCEKTGILLCYDGRIYDMRVPADKREFTRDAVQSEEEAESTAARADRTARLNALRGAPHGKVPFGYTRRYDPNDGHLIGQVAHPDNADVVRDAFRRAAAQESINAIAERLRKHIPDLTRAGLRYLLSNRTYLGVRHYKGEDMTECQWPAIVDEVLFMEVQETLRDPDRRTSRESRVKYLLSGIARCAVCDSPEGLRAGMRQGAWRYRCHDNGHVMLRRDVLDAVVEEALIEWLSSREAVAVFTRREDGGQLDRLRLKVFNMKTQITAAREQASTFDDNGMPMLTIESLAMTERQLLPMIAGAEREIAALTAAEDPVLSRLVGKPRAAIEDSWNTELTLSQQRHVLRHTVNVVLRRASRRGVRTLEPGRVGLVFAGEPGFSARMRRGSSQV